MDYVIVDQTAPLALNSKDAVSDLEAEVIALPLAQRLQDPDAESYRLTSDRHFGESSLLVTVHEHMFAHPEDRKGL